MIKLFKFFFITIIFVSIFILILPWFVDKQKILALLNEKIKTEFNLNISYDEDVSISFFPFPTLKINSFIYFDKVSGINLAIKKLNLSSTWKSIINFKPEIVSLEAFSPSLKLNANNSTKKSDYIKLNVKNSENYNLDKLKSIKEKIELIKIYDGTINLNNINNLNIDEFNFTMRVKDGFVGNGEF